MNAFVAKLDSIDGNVQFREKLQILQVNMGDLCNQHCSHCHVNAGPNGKKVMEKETVDHILEFLSHDKDLILDITGGAPEMNPHFDFFVTSARPLVKEIIVRSNLTVIFEPGKEYLPSFYKENNVHLICSLPCYTEENVDRQRGNGVFEKSIKALQLLNEKEYGRDSGFPVDLVYNPVGAFLPEAQEGLENDYKKMLKDKHGIDFNKLVTITNSPISRFKEQLVERNEYADYMELLKDNFNKKIVKNIMCRTLLSVGWDGLLYDCDFNQAIGMTLKDGSMNEINIEDIKPDDVTGRNIMFENHCFSCTAGSGSSCLGVLEESREGGEGISCCEGACESDALDDTRNMVSEYYGQVIDSSDDLKTTACCGIESVPAYIRKITSLIESEITSKFYGCGSPIPLELKDSVIVDLGCGTGKDTYLMSYLVGENGKVIGVDMTEEQLNVARKYHDIQMDKFGFKKSNIDFHKGYIEDLKTLGIKDSSVDLVVSNCVINLSAKKEMVLSEIYRVLKDGGEFYFSDVFVDRRLPDWTKEDPVLVGECLGGALYWRDFERMAAVAGFTDVRIFSKNSIKLSNSEIEQKIGFADFTSITYRMFKIKDLEDACEDYGQEALYKGGIEHSPDGFKLDDHHYFPNGEYVKVCGNTADMLSRSRYGKHFDIKGNKEEHFGLFPGCGDSFSEENRPGTCEPRGGSCC